MKWDSVWQILRYLLIAGGGVLVGKGYFTAEQLTTVVGGIGTVGAIIWGLYVKSGTTAVPDSTAARSDVPTVSAATGTIAPATTGPQKGDKTP